MPLDYLSTPLVSKRLSAVLLIQLWNPDETYASEELVPSALTNPMIVKVPLQKTTLATYLVSYCDTISNHSTCELDRMHWARHSLRLAINKSGPDLKD